MKKSHAEVLMEQIAGDVKAVLEVVNAQPTRTEFNELRDDVADIKRRVVTIEAAVKATNRELTGHKHEGDLKLMLRAPRRPAN